MSFGQHLQHLRLKAGLSQAGLADRAGIPVKTIQNWEISRRSPRWIGMLLKLAQGLSVSMEELAAAALETDGGGPPAKKARARPRKGKVSE